MAGGPATTEGGEIAPYTYRLGMFEDTTTDNFWAAQDTLSTVWNSYVRTPTKPALYTINYPGLELVPDLAASTEIPSAEPDRRSGGSTSSPEGMLLTEVERSDSVRSPSNALPP